MTGERTPRMPTGVGAQPRSRPMVAGAASWDLLSTAATRGFGSAGTASHVGPSSRSLGSLVGGFGGEGDPARPHLAPFAPKYIASSPRCTARLCSSCNSSAGRTTAWEPSPAPVSTRPPVAVALGAHLPASPRSARAAVQDFAGGALPATPWPGQGRNEAPLCRGLDVAGGPEVDCRECRGLPAGGRS